MPKQNATNPFTKWGVYNRKESPGYMQAMQCVPNRSRQNSKLSTQCVQNKIDVRAHDEIKT